MLLNTTENAKITISLEQDSENDSFEFSQTAYVDLSLFDSIADALANRMNIFVDLIGYENSGEFIFLDNLKPDECDYIKNALSVYRKFKEENK